MILPRIVGICACVLLIPVSVSLNAIYAFGWSDVFLYQCAMASVFASLDLIKIFLPWRIADDWKSRNRSLASALFCVLSLSALWLLLACCSIAASYAFTKQLTTASTDKYQHNRNQIGDLRSELRRLITKRDASPSLPRPSVIQAQAQAILATPITSKRKTQTLGQLSSDCRKPTWVTKKRCASYTKLQTKLAAARANEKLAQRIADLRAQISSVAPATDTASRTEVMERTFGLSQSDALYYQLIVMVFIIELCAAIGPYLVFSMKGSNKTTSPPETDIPVDPDLYFADRLEFQKGARVRASDLYEDFSTWCRDKNISPITVTAFGNWLTSKHPHKVKSAGVVLYQDLAFRRSS